MSYLGRSAKLSLKAQEKVSFLATAGQTVKTGLSYTVGFIEVYVNGVLLTDTTDFTATNGSSITFTVALLLNDEVTVISLKTFTVADHYNKTEADTLLSAKATNTALALKAPIASPVFTGNVGINNSSPTQRLETNGNAQFNMYDNPSGAGGYYTTKGMQIGNAFDAGLSGGDDDRNAIVWNERGTSLLFGTNNIEHMRINADGIVTKPLQPAFSACLSTSHTFAATTTTIVFDSEIFDQNSDFNAPSATFTAPVTGKYQFNISIRVDNMDQGAGYHRLKLKTSNGEYQPVIIGAGSVFNSDLSYFFFTMPVLADMDAGDTAYVQFQVSGGATQAQIHASRPNANFSGYLVC